MKAFCLAVFLAMSFTDSGRGQTTARITRDGSMVISDGRYRFRIADVVVPPRASISPPRVHAVLKRHGGYFVLVTTCERSRGGTGGGYCGCGEEDYLRWMHIVDKRVCEHVHFRYRSCFDNREGGIQGWKGSIFTVTTEDLLEDRLLAKETDIWQEITYTFDADHPEAGIREEKASPHP